MTIDSIKEELIGQIKASEAVIALPAVFEQKPDLVTYMMDVAEANDIGIFCIRPFGGLLETPKELEARAGEPVAWNARELIDRLRKVGRGEDTQRWETIGLPVTLIDEISMARTGNTYLVSTTGLGQTFCPQQEWEPTGTSRSFVSQRTT